MMLWSRVTTFRCSPTHVTPEMSKKLDKNPEDFVNLKLSVCICFLLVLCVVVVFSFLFVIEHMMPLCMVISWVYSVAMMIQHIVAEKEHRLKEVRVCACVSTLLIKIIDILKR